MVLPEVKNTTHKLIDVAAEWNCSLEDLFNFAERDLLQICQQRNPDVPVLNLFSSGEEKEAIPFYENEPLEINNFKARELYKRYQDFDEPFILVITDIEKTRFEKKYNLTQGNDRNELTTPSPCVEEFFPSLSTNEKPINGLEDIADYIGLTYDYLKGCWKKKGCPINKSKKNRKLYAFPSQLDNWRSRQ